MHESQVTNHENSFSRRKLLMTGVKLTFLGVAAASLRSSEQRRYRNAERPPLRYVYNPQLGVYVETGPSLATLCERTRLSAAIQRVDQLSAPSSFALADVPAAGTQLPALVLYSQTHEDHPDENTSPLQRALIRFKDILASDRMMFIISRDPKVVPAVASAYADGDNGPEMVFFPIQPLDFTSQETFQAALQHDFPEITFSEDLITALYTGTVRGFWRNFGSSLGHGALPDIFLVRSTR